MVAFVGLAWSLSARAVGGEPASPSGEAVFQSGAQLVHVTATVRDRSGGLVRGLAAEDFTVTDGRHPRSLMFFQASADMDRPRSESMPLNIALLMDESGSMAPVMSAAQLAVVRLLDLSVEARSLHFVSFADSVAATAVVPDNRTAVIDRVRGTKAGGGNVLFDAVAHAASLVAGETGRRVVIVIGDGGEERSKISEQKLIEQLLASGTVVYAVGPSWSVVDEYWAERAVLERLVEASGGSFLTLGPEFEKQFAALREELSSQYVLGFEPFPSKKSEWRKIGVEVKGGLQVRHRSRYLAHRTPSQ